MSVVFEQVLTLFIFSAVGYILARCKIVNAAHTGILSKLLVYVVLPCNIFRTFAGNCTVAYLTENYRLVLTSAGVLAVLMIVMPFLARLFSKENYPRRVYEYSLVIPNYGYMGYALAESLLGMQGLISIMMYAIPTAIYTYTVGFCSLTKRPLQLRKLINPVIIALVLGIIAGLTSLPIPAVINSVLSKSSACMAPLSMLMAGIVISQFPLREILREPRTYILTALRLLVIPTVIGGTLMLLGLRAEAQTSILLFAMPCGLNTIVFPQIVNEDCRIGAGLAFVSNILACATIPLVFALFGVGA